jgi:SAM-dependent methyltransferase
MVMTMEADSIDTSGSIPWLAKSTPETWANRIRSHAPDHVIADWGSAESQERRLRAILRLPLRSAESLLDFGCGTGRLADLVPPGVNYVGMDWSSAIVEEARRRRPGCDFRLGAEADIPEADWIVASGPFNVRGAWSKSRTGEAIRKMWHASRRGIAVTVLRTPARDRLHYDPKEVFCFLDGLDWCELELDRSYLPNDLCLRAWRT